LQILCWLFPGSAKISGVKYVKYPVKENGKTVPVKKVAVSKKNETAAGRSLSRWALLGFTGLNGSSSFLQKATV
jgi:hypothetical protein